MNVSTILLYALTTFFILIAQVIIIKSRYNKFTNQDFVLRFRNGKLMNQGFGGGYFILPLIDELIVLSTTVNNIKISTGKLITRDYKDIKVNGFVIWRIEDPVKAHQSIFHHSEMDGIAQTNKILEQLFESSIRIILAELTLDQILAENEYIIQTIMTEIVSVVNPMGIKIITTEISNVDTAEAKLMNVGNDAIYSKGSIETESLDSQNNIKTHYKEIKL